MQGDLTIRASTLAGNTAAGGLPAVPDPGKGLGGAVFNLSGSLEAVGVTFAENTATHDGSSIYNLVYDAKTTRAAQATLRDSIVADANPQIDLVSDKPSMTLDLQPNLGSATALVGDFDLVRTYVARDAGTVDRHAAHRRSAARRRSRTTAGPRARWRRRKEAPSSTRAPPSGSSTDQRGLSRPFDFSAIAERRRRIRHRRRRAAAQPTGSSGGGGPGSTTPAFGAKTLVTLTLAAKRIPARGPLKIRVANANGFEITGRLSGQTVNRISAARKRRIKLRAKQFKVAGQRENGRPARACRSPSGALLKRTGRVRLRLTAKVRDPADNARTVKKRVTPRLKTEATKSLALSAKTKPGKEEGSG